MPKYQNWIIVLFLLLLFGLIYSVGKVTPTERTTAEIPYSAFKSLVAERRVDTVTISGDKIEGRFAEPTSVEGIGSPLQGFSTRVPAFGDDTLLPSLEQAKVKVTVEAADDGLFGGSGWIWPWIILLAVYIWFWRRMFGNVAGGLGRGGALDKFLRTPGGDAKKETPDVNFDDVAGQENAKREVAELVDYLRHADQYRRVGAEVPKGVLLMGPPGTGKTLLAKALAGEAGVPFFSISASEFIEVFVGVGASRVRNLFADAKKAAPAIIFIDELDSVGRVRGTGLGGGNDEREQTLNQILAELDGFTGREAVVVLAATNRPDVLDPALLRPGRFDRHITLDLPDRKARVDILKVHARDVPLAADVDLDVIARGTPGFSGADLKNLVNEAAMMAAREKADHVTARHFEEMRERVLLGAVRTLAIGPKDKRRLAVHEAGHTTVAYFLPEADPLFKVTIIPRGRALGGTQQLPQEERYIMHEAFLRDRLAVILAGRAAEKTVYGNVSSGADDDIHQATSLARMMVSRWGMSETVGPMDARESEEHPFLGREIAQPRKTSEATAHAVDEAVRNLLNEADKRAADTIAKNRDRFDRLVDKLEEHESLDREDIDGILGLPAEVKQDNQEPPLAAGS